MAYKTYTEQVQEHLKALNDNGLCVSELKLDSARWIRCHGHKKTRGRGEYSYISNTEQLSNGLYGIRTSFRGAGGIGSHKTYGLPSSGNENISIISQQHKENNEEQELAARKAYGFWSHSNTQGKSDYLERKGVESYGIRFRSSEQYGNVAVVPMFDEHGKLWSYQLLNPDGTKRHPKGCRTEGLFHRLGKLMNGESIGIAESYVTAATCMELSGVPTVCAFTSENLVSVSQAVRFFFPASPIILFTDNDRHLVEKGYLNKGILKAQEAQKLCKDRVGIALPDFGDLKPSKEVSDWNDLMNALGKGEAKRQIEIFCSRLVK